MNILGNNLLFALFISHDLTFSLIGKLEFGESDVSSSLLLLDEGIYLYVVQQVTPLPSLSSNNPLLV